MTLAALQWQWEKKSTLDVHCPISGLKHLQVILHWNEWNTMATWKSKTYGVLWEIDCSNVKYLTAQYSNGQNQINNRIQKVMWIIRLSLPLSYIFSRFFCLGLDTVNLALRLWEKTHLWSSQISHLAVLLFFFSLSFHSGNIESVVPKSSCDFLCSPQLTMLPLKNSSLNKATLTSTHTYTHTNLGFLILFICLFQSSLCHYANVPK